MKNVEKIQNMLGREIRGCLNVLMGEQRSEMYFNSVKSEFTQEARLR